MALLLYIILSVLLANVQSKDIFCDKDIYDTTFHTYKLNGTIFPIDSLVIWSPTTKKDIHPIADLCSYQTGIPPLQHQCSATKLRDKTQTWDYTLTDIVDCQIIKKRSCQEESFEHDYIMKNKFHKKHTNKWPATAMNELAMPLDICLLSSGQSLNRKCIYNKQTYKAEWQKLDGNVKCLKEINETIITNDLNTLYHEVKNENQTLNSEKVVTELTKILGRKDHKRIASDLEISTNIMKIMTFADRTPSMASKFIQVTDLLMQSEESAVLNSLPTNTPNNLVSTVESYYDNMTRMFMPNTTDCSDQPDGVKYFIENMTSVFYIYPICSNISGIGTYSASSGSEEMRYDNHTNTYFKYIRLNESLEDLIYDPFIMNAVYFPEDAWAELQNMQPKEDNQVHAIRISLYKNRNFFVGRKHRAPDSVVLKVSVPGYGEDLPLPIPYIFSTTEPENTPTPMGCGSYNYDFWSLSDLSITKSDYASVCEVKNLHFGALLRLKASYVKATDMTVLNVILGYGQDIITICGCILSLFGLFVIWMTALCCPQWRRKASNLLLLNICAVLTPIMAYFLFINIGDIRQSFINRDNLQYCILEGALLQYLILVLFMWLLLMARFQYRRYTQITETIRSTCDNVIYMLIAWGLPLVPTLIVAFVNPQSYIPFSENGLVSSNICYPSGWSFYFGIFAPIATVVTINVALYVYTMCFLRCTKSESRVRKDRKRILLELRLSIVLFFFLGISWIFGILAHMQESQAMSFLFCLTSTLQGFFLFLQFVVSDKETMSSWFICICGESYYTDEDVSLPL
ncbi:adhesion G-protein coupled receptor G6-like, partial [Musca vetustissima]|uniref:adhesion G-protein coupled receptor G6-like n=1 Tax=Musca vetustissima TaxID=27455 RepID=UPI002AB6577F